MIFASADDFATVSVDPAWTDTPVNGDLWWIGAYGMVVELGDWHQGDPANSRAFERVELHFEKTVNSANVIDAAVDNQDVAAGGAYVYSAGTVAGSREGPDERLELGDNAGRVQRLRLQALINGERPILRGLTVDLIPIDEGP